MGASRGDFVKYPRTAHLFGSQGTSDDKHLGERESIRFLADESLIVEKKIDGTNVGIHFVGTELFLQCRGHQITEGMHPQYDLFKQWVMVKRGVLQERLGEPFILYGEWVYAKRSIHYRKFSHYFFEFDIFDKDAETFLTLEKRTEQIADAGIEAVRIVYRGPVKRALLKGLIGESAFDGEFDHPVTGRRDNRLEGLYLRDGRRKRFDGASQVSAA